MTYLVRFLLLGLLAVLLVRSVWQLLISIVEGASVTPTGKSGPPQRGVAMVRDPVCGTFVVPSAALTLDVGGRRTCFCSEKCRRAFEAGGGTRSAAAR